MTKQSILCGVFGLFSILVQAQKTDYALVEETVNYYLNGGTNNDFETLKKAFHDNATMKFMGDEGYKEVNALVFFGNAMKEGGKVNRKTFVSEITITGKAANARLEIVYPDATVVDYMNLLKFDDGWKIVNKIFDVRSLKKLFPDE